MTLVLTAGCAYQASDMNILYVSVIMTEAKVRLSGVSHSVAASPSDARVFVRYHLRDPFLFPYPESPIYMGEISSFGPGGERY